MNIIILIDGHLKGYLLSHLGQYWGEAGHSVSYLRGVRDPMPAADLLFMHVDMTVLPPEYVEAMKSYTLVINGRVMDISKQLFSQVMLSEGEGYDHPVIVKTKNNCGGLPEINRRVGAEKFMEVMSVPKTWEEVEGLPTYPIFQNLAAVPPGVWKNQHLIVEKFLPEVDADGNYRVREWLFFGDRDIHFTNISKNPIVKGGNVMRREYLPENSVPPELAELRRVMGFDYGKFDYGMVDGKPVLYDINKTPGAPEDLSGRPGADGRIRQMSLGLNDWLKEKGVTP